MVQLVQQPNQTKVNLLDAACFFTLLCGFIVLPLVCTSIFDDHFTIGKWIIFHFLAITAFVIQQLSTNAQFYPTAKKPLTAISFLLLMYVIIEQVIWNDQQMFLYPWVDRLCFVMLVCSFFFCMKIIPSSVNLFINSLSVSAFIVTSLGFLEVVFGKRSILNLVDANTEYESIYSTFGNANMTAEFIGVSIIALIYSLQRPTKRKFQYLKELILAGCLSYLLLLNSRSAYLGLALAAIILFLFKLRLKKATAVRVTLITLIIFISALRYSQESNLYLNGTNNPNTTFPHHVSDRKQLIPDHRSMIESKRRSYIDRLAVWKASGQMFLNYPMGVGYGRFEFNHIKYLESASEEWLYKSPHNEFFRVLAEDGIIFFSLIVAILLLVLYHFQQEIKFESMSTDDKYVIAGSLYTLIQALFQFPLNNAFTTYHSAFLLGYVCSRVLSTGNKKRYVNIKIILSLLIVFVSAELAIDHLVAEYYYGSYKNNYQKVSEACHREPSHWRVCNLKAQHEFSESMYADAENTLINTLQIAKYNYPALKLLGQLYEARHDYSNACISYMVYDNIFNYKSSLHKLRENMCQSHHNNFDSNSKVAQMYKNELKLNDFAVLKP